MQQLARRLIRFSAWLLEPDHLPPLLPDSSRRRATSDFSARRETRPRLPLLEESFSTRKQFFSWLASSEPMPDKTADSAPLPISILGWLFGSESLTTDQRPQPTKEVSIHGS